MTNCPQSYWAMPYYSKRYFKVLWSCKNLCTQWTSHHARKGSKISPGATYTTMLVHNQGRESARNSTISYFNGLSFKKMTYPMQHDTDSSASFPLSTDSKRYAVNLHQLHSDKLAFSSMSSVCVFALLAPAQLQEKWICMYSWRVKWMVKKK